MKMLIVLILLFIFSSCKSTSEIQKLEGVKTRSNYVHFEYARTDTNNILHYSKINISDTTHAQMSIYVTPFSLMNIWYIFLPYADTVKNKVIDKNEKIITDSEAFLNKGFYIIRTDSLSLNNEFYFKLKTQFCDSVFIHVLVGY